MPKLILSVDDKIVDEYSIEKDTITIGRRTDNDICLDNLAISGHHTQITTVLNDSFIEDLNSTNGTFVNSKIVKKHALKDGDVIDIGTHRIKYINHLATSSANGDFEQTVVMTPQSNQNHTDSAIQKNIDNSIAEVVNWIDAIADSHNITSDDSSDEDKAAIQNPADETNLIENISTDNDKETADPTETVDENEENTTGENNSDDNISADSNDGKKDSYVAAIDENKQPSPKASLATPLATSINKLGFIQILSGSNTGKELVLDKSLTTIGKPNVAVVGITKRRNSYFIIHVEGSEENVSKLNGEIIKGKAQPLEDHDIIDVAGIKLEFFVE